MIDVNQGDFVIVTSAEYSSYGIMCFCRATKDFDTHEVTQEYLRKFPEQREEYKGNEEQFGTYLIDNGFLEKLHCKELHVGSDSSITPTIHELSKEIRIF